MTCQKIEILISAYIDGEITGEEKHLVDIHLQHCVACRTLMIEFSRLHLLYQEMEEREAPRDFRQRVTQRLEARTWKLFPWRIPRLVYALSFLFLVVAGGLGVRSWLTSSGPSLDDVEVYAEDILFGNTFSSSTDLFSLNDGGIAEEILSTIDFSEPSSSNDTSLFLDDGVPRRSRQSHLVVHVWNVGGMV